MNIEINILPKELRARPLVDARTVILIVLVIALGYGCYFFYQARSDVQSKNAEIAARTAAIKQEVMTVSTNPEAVALQNSIKQLQAAKQSYDTYMASKVEWGDALTQVYAAVPKGVSITNIAQSGNNLVITATASNYTAVAEYGLALDSEADFVLLGIPSFSGSTATLNIGVTPGGAQ
jgi:Tfp pilus assembly protein PilN